MAIVDEGLEILHEDLADNVLTGQSYNFLDNTNDPTLDPATDNEGDHGTSVAGIIGMKAYNNVCLLYTSPSPRDLAVSRMPSSA